MPAPCFTVDLPAGWSSQPTQHCGLALNGPNGAGCGISVDTEAIDAATLRDLIAAKYSDVDVSEETIDGERVLVGTGAIPGVIYIVVQARSATTEHAGYYAQCVTTDPVQVAEITRIFTTLRASIG